MGERSCYISDFAAMRKPTQIRGFSMQHAVSSDIVLLIIISNVTYMD